MLVSFQFYFDLVFNNGHQSLLSDFIGNKELLNKGFEYLKEYDYYLKDEMIVDDVEPVFEITIITKEIFLEEKFQDKKKLFLGELNAELSSFEPDERKTYLTKVFTDLYNIHKKVLNTEINHQQIIENKIKDLIDDLTLLYKDEIISHKLFARINSLEKDSLGTFFGLKPYIKISFLIELYDICIDLFLVDDEEVSEEEFISAFTSNKPDPEYKVRFIEKNYPIVYFLESIQPFFDNLSFTSIEESSNLYNKQFKKLTATDLSTTKSRNKNTSLPIIPKIDNAISVLKSKYLE